MEENHIRSQDQIATPQQPIHQQTETSPPLPSSRKKYTILLVIVILFLGAGLFIWQTNQRTQSLESELRTEQIPKKLDITPLPTPIHENWKAYTNAKDNFSIQYPESYQHSFGQDVNKNEPSPDAIQSLDLEAWFSGEPKIVGGYTGDHIVLSIFPDAGDSWSKIPTIASSDETILFGGEKALKHMGADGVTIGPIKHNGYIYEFHYDASETKPDTDSFYTMVSSFMFIK